MRFSIPVLAAFVLSSAAPLCAQTQAYEPDYETPAGRELVGVFISSHTFQGEHAEGLTEAVEELKLILSERAREEGVNFRMVAVIVDWETEVSLDYLADFGVFDELVVGSNWFNVGAQHFLWADTTKKTIIPQVQVLERHVGFAGKRRVEFGEPRLLIQVPGLQQIIGWVGEGATLPSSADAL